MEMQETRSRKPLPAAASRRRAAVVLSVAALSLLVFVFLADTIGLSRDGVTGVEKVVGSFAILLLVIGATPARARVRRLLALVAVAMTALYLTLLAGELVLRSLRPPEKRNAETSYGLAGVFQVSPWGGFQLKPGWEGRYDDGVVQAPVRVNSLGDRDDPPTSGDDATERWLIVGDSFAFGYVLAQDQTIDKQIERLSGGKVDAYNLGVSGYGPGDCFKKLELSSWWRGDHIIYLVFNNDFRNDNVEPAIYTAFEGVVVPRLAPDGKPYTEADYKERSRLVRKPTERAVLDEVLTFQLIRQRVRSLLDPETVRLDGSQKQFQPENVESAVSYTRKMADLAEQRGAAFHVVIVPSLGEVGTRTHSAPVRAYLDAVRREKLHVIELLNELTPDDYFVHDGHFDESGARRTAEILLRELRK